MRFLGVWPCNARHPSLTFSHRRVCVIQVLTEQARKRPDLVYRFAPELIQRAPEDLIKLARWGDFFSPLFFSAGFCSGASTYSICCCLTDRQYPNIEPRELIPAFVRYQQQAKSIDKTTMVIVEYLGVLELCGQLLVLWLTCQLAHHLFIVFLSLNNLQRAA